MKAVVCLALMLALALPVIGLAQPIVTVSDRGATSESCPPATFQNCTSVPFRVEETGDYALDTWVKCETSCAVCVSCAAITRQDIDMVPITCASPCNTDPCARTCRVHLIAGAPYILNVCLEQCPDAPAVCGNTCIANACVRKPAARPCF